MSLLHVRLRQNHMATTFSFTISCSANRKIAAEQVLEECHRLVDGIELELTEFKEVSPIFQLNRSQVGQAVELTPSGYYLFKKSRWIHEISGGVFDVAAKSACPNRPVFEWNDEQRTVWKIHPEAHMGFGAIGKGYALDRVRERVEREGFMNYVLNAGGSSQILSGFSAEEEPWSWGWSWERDSDGDDVGVSFEHKTGKTIALGISGYHEQGRHIIDSRSGKLSEQNLSALVGHEQATDADAWSTALLISGWDDVSERLKSHGRDSAMALVENKSSVRWNGIFEGMWGGLQSLLVLVSLFLGQLCFASEEEAIDLSDLGFEEFTPYIFERDAIWMALPALSLLLVFIHLKKIKSDRVIPEKLETIE